MTMTSIPRLSGMLRKLFLSEASELARAHGVIQRFRVFSGASLLQLCVFGWLQDPKAGPSALARFAGGLGLQLSKQAIEERFTMQTAEWLLAVLRRGVQYLVCAQAVSIPRLAAVYGGAAGRWQNDQLAREPQAGVAWLWGQWAGSGPQADGALGFAGRRVAWSVCA